MCATFSPSEFISHEICTDVQNTKCPEMNIGFRFETFLLIDYSFNNVNKTRIASEELGFMVVGEALVDNF